MAELILNLHSPTYEDGDVLVALNARRVQCIHAEHICHWQREQRNSAGLRINGGISRRMLDRMYQYRFERVNANQVERIETDYLGNEIGRLTFGPPQIDVAEFVKRRLRHASHRIFGTAGREIWHGGRLDVSAAAMSEVWSDIQTHSPHTPGLCTHCGQHHGRWCMGRLDVRHFLCVQVPEMSDARVAALVAPDARTWTSRQVPTDPDGVPVFPIWSADNRWQHPTGGWVYQRDPQTQEVSVTFRKRNVRASDWVRDMAPAVQKTATQIRDRSHVVGVEHSLPDPTRAPWQRGEAQVQRITEHTPLGGATLMRNKRTRSTERPDR